MLSSSLQLARIICHLNGTAMAAPKSWVFPMQKQDEEVVEVEEEEEEEEVLLGIPDASCDQH